MLNEVKTKLIELANKYEISEFVNEDPSQFLRWYSDVCDVEVASFIAAMLSFGNRKQFIPKIKSIFEKADKAGGVCVWIKQGQFYKNFACVDGVNIDLEKKFYRFYSYADMICFFEEIKEILQKADSFGSYFCESYRKKIDEFSEKSDKCKKDEINLGWIISDAFPKSKIVPKGKNCANKRVHMFLRWMVRQNSPVDLGLWKWFNSCDLIIPLDTHVLQESIKLGLISEKATGSLKTAKLITQQLKEIWKDDPCKGDFALFGLGIS